MSSPRHFCLVNLLLLLLVSSCPSRGKPTEATDYPSVSTTDASLEVSSEPTTDAVPDLGSDGPAIGVTNGEQPPPSPLPPVGAFDEKSIGPDEDKSLDGDESGKSIGKEDEVSENKHNKKRTADEVAEAETSADKGPAEKSEKADGGQGNRGATIVQTHTGDVEGYRDTAVTPNVFAFIGIPYAQPPVGELRFKLPKLVRPWTRTYRAGYWAPMCEQTLPVGAQLPYTTVNPETSEDCLYLNIWTPSVDKEKLKPVMVWFHGGLFSFGSSTVLQNVGRTLSSQGDVVVVTFNSRLSAYGYLNLDIPEAPGNMGLYDQNMALKWIASNIQEFGGDPTQVTLFGSGGGAIAIGMHMASPMSRNLFKRAILQSGSPLLLNFMFEEAQNTSEKVAEQLGCNNDNGDLAFTDPDAVLSCINAQPKRNFREAVEGVLDENPLAFMPSLGDRFSPVSALKAFGDSDYYYDQQKEILLGVNADEGSLFLNYALPAGFNMETINSTQQVKQVLNDLLETKWPLPDSLREHAKKFFLNIDSETFNSPEAYAKHLYRAFSDNVINCPVAGFAKLFSRLQNSTVYTYEFTERSSKNNYPKWMGVNHYEEVQFVFGLPLQFPSEYTPKEVEFSKRIMNTWVTFAKTGKPTPQLEKEWPQFTDENKSFMILDADGADIGTDMDKNCRLFELAVNSE